MPAIECPCPAETECDDAATGPYPVTQADVDFAFILARLFAARLPHLVDEYESVALVGLARAARSFDPGLGCRFRTYAALRINGEMLDFARHEIPKGYGRLAKRRNIAWPTTTSLDATREHPDSGDFVPAIEVAADTFAVGWEAEYQDDLMSLTRGLPPGHAGIVRDYFGRADLATMKKTATSHGISESRVSQIITLSIETIANRHRSTGR